MKTQQCVKCVTPTGGWSVARTERRAAGQPGDRQAASRRRVTSVRKRRRPGGEPPGRRTWRKLVGAFESTVRVRPTAALHRPEITQGALREKLGSRASARRNTGAGAESCLRSYRTAPLGHLEPGLARGLVLSPSPRSADQKDGTRQAGSGNGCDNDHCAYVATGRPGGWWRGTRSCRIGCVLGETRSRHLDRCATCSRCCRRRCRLSGSSWNTQYFV